MSEVYPGLMAEDKELCDLIIQPINKMYIEVYKKDVRAGIVNKDKNR